MTNQKIALAPLSKQVRILKKILLANQVLVKTLKLLRKTGLPDWYLGGGAIPQIAWNHYHGFEPNYKVKDFDIVYFDKKDLSKKGELKREKAFRQKYPVCSVKLELVNEARTHLWYENDFGKKIQPYTCAQDAIYGFPTTASAVGIRLNKAKRLEIFAPHGLTDLFGLVIRPNRIQITKDIYQAKCRRWKKAWPKLTIIPWEYGL